MSGYIFQISSSGGGVPKLARREAVVTQLGLEGDGHDDQVNHGGAERALCLYSLERILALQQEGHPIFPGSVGENLTVRSLPWLEMIPGSKWELGDEVRIEITRYTTPCKTIQQSFRAGEFNLIHHEKRPGWSRVYARVLQGGRIRVGMSVRSQD